MPSWPRGLVIQLQQQRSRRVGHVDGDHHDDIHGSTAHLGRHHDSADTDGTVVILDPSFEFNLFFDALFITHPNGALDTSVDDRRVDYREFLGNVGNLAIVAISEQFGSAEQ